MQTLRNVSATLSPLGLAILRIVVGVIMIAHGWQKLTAYDAWYSTLQQLGVPMLEVLAPLSVAAELAGGVGILVGLLTPIAAFGVLCQMIAAIYLVHWDFGLFASNGGFEYPLTIAAVALFLTVRGAGLISLDALLFGRAARRTAREEREERRGRRRPLEEAPA